MNVFKEFYRFNFILLLLRFPFKYLNRKKYTLLGLEQKRFHHRSTIHHNQNRMTKQLQKSVPTKQYNKTERMKNLVHKKFISKNKGKNWRTTFSTVEDNSLKELNKKTTFSKQFWLTCFSSFPYLFTFHS